MQITFSTLLALTNLRILRMRLCLAKEDSMRSHYWGKLSVSQHIEITTGRSLRSWDQPHSTLRKAMPWDCLMSSWHPVRVNCSTVGKPLIGGRREARVTFSLRSTGLEQLQHACKYRENLFVPRLEGSRWRVKCGKRGCHQVVGLCGSDAEHAECNLDGELGVRRWAMKRLAT